MNNSEKVKINPEWEKLVGDFWLHWGLAPKGTPKYEAGIKALDFIYKHFFSKPYPSR